MRSETVQPRPGTRPANRRDLILQAARALFLRRGYDHVSVSDIAAAVSIGPSALYRHFPGKQQILLEVLRVELAALDATLSTHLDTPAVTDPGAHHQVIAQLALEFRGVRPLVQREARHLDPDDREEVRAATRAIARKVGHLVRRIRPDLDLPQAELMTWAVVGVSGSTNTRTKLDAEEFRALILTLVASVVHTPFPPSYDVAEPVPEHAPVRLTSRRELLLEEATLLFAERGYSHIAVEDIGAASGISGPSVYNHFPGKLDLLMIPLRRALAFLMHDLVQQVRLSRDNAEAVERVVRSYVIFALTSPHLVTLLVTEVRNLPEPVRRGLLNQQIAYARELMGLLAPLRPDLDHAHIEAIVTAVLMVVGDVARVPRMAATPGADEFLIRMAIRMMRCH